MALSSSLQNTINGGAGGAVRRLAVRDARFKEAYGFVPDELLREDADVYKVERFGGGDFRRVFALKVLAPEAEVDADLRASHLQPHQPDHALLPPGFVWSEHGGNSQDLVLITHMVNRRS